VLTEAEGKRNREICVYSLVSVWFSNVNF